MKLREDKGPVVKIDKMPGYEVVNPTPDEVDKATEEQQADKEIVKKDSDAAKETDKSGGNQAALKDFIANILDDVKEFIKAL